MNLGGLDKLDAEELSISSSGIIFLPCDTWIYLNNNKYKSQISKINQSKQPMQPIIHHRVRSTANSFSIWESAQYPPMLSPVCAINTGQWGKAAAPCRSPRNNNISGNYERVRENIWQMLASLWVKLWHLTARVVWTDLWSPLQQSQPPAPSAPAY